ncbi:MAG: copper homeostasis protein CutC [Cyanothece sp. SIO1E1]|nr:copper homeostasis protein CutC [Cyanothece sp. SIO1E1]
MLLEACVETLEEAILAEQRGAHRLELCSRLDLDGLSPGRDLAQQVVAAVNIPVKVMIRHRGGSFHYSAAEIEAMAEEIQAAQGWGIAGIVIGLLDEQGEINIEGTQQLAMLANGLSVTFHKAIDETPNLLKSLQSLSDIPNIDTILTSGGAATAEAGCQILRKMMAQSPAHLTILPAGRITQANLTHIHQLLGAQAYHGRRIVGELNP